MNMKIFYLALITLLLSSCSLFKSKTETIESVSMSRSGCYGKCPIYTVKVFKDGSVTYEGKMFVDHIGSYSLTKKVNFQELENLVEQTDFFKLEDRYMLEIADIPSCGVTVTTNEKVKSVLENGEGPLGVKKIQGFLDTFLKNTTEDDWLKKE